MSVEAQAIAETSEICSPEPSQLTMFLPENILREANLVCAYARADKIINSEDCDLEMMLQARGFLMEIFSKLEKIQSNMDKDDPSGWHPELLKTILHYQQGCLSMVLNDLPNAENELKVRTSSHMKQRNIIDQIGTNVPLS